jgi:hypothetical protein
MGVLIEVFEIVELLRDKLRLLNRKELHLVQELQAAKKAGNNWIAQHGEKIEEELQEWEKVSDTRLAGIHQAMKDISKAMADQKEDFEDDVRTILDRLHNVFLTYEAIFKK